jgi:hypothetical protein
MEIHANWATDCDEKKEKGFPVQNIKHIWLLLRSCMGQYIKFRFSKKATKFEKISRLDLTFTK